MRFRRQVASMALLMIATTVPAFGQTATDDLLRTLISEVHELRLALERSTLVGYRGQLLIEQLRAQNNRLSSLRADLQRVSDNLASEERQRSQLDVVVSNLEEEVKKRFDAEERLRMERQLRMVEAEAEQSGRRRTELQQRESDIQIRIRETEERIDEIQRKIDLLEQSMNASGESGPEAGQR